ncbi:MAG TPA: ferritin-like domain-containing protein [Nocardioidaceae bacterium]|nr:ferritin-like domain-containing protein [Nocardioidaceae bacterium]
MKPLQTALAAEHAAVFAYGVIGAVLGAASEAADADLAAAGYAAHRRRRDQLIARLGQDAVAAEAAYALPFDVDSERSARRLGRLVEQRCAAVYADVVSRTAGEARMLAATALTDCAVRGLGWGVEPEPFPGLGELR